MPLRERVPSPLRKTRIVRARLEANLVQPFESALKESGLRESDFLRAAIREKLNHQAREQRLEERYVESLNRVERRLAGLSSMMRLIFAGIATLAFTFFRYFREPVGLSSQENERTLPARLLGFRHSVVNQFYGELGREFDALTNPAADHRSRTPEKERQTGSATDRTREN